MILNNAWLFVLNILSFICYAAVFVVLGFFLNRWDTGYSQHKMEENLPGSECLQVYYDCLNKDED